MPRSSPSWWPWVQRNLDKNGWTPADLAREISALVDDGPGESVIGRWKNRGSQPTRKSVEAVALAFHRPTREALIAAGHVTPRDVNAPWPASGRIDLTIVPDEALIEEVSARILRKRPSPAPSEKPRERRPAEAANGSNGSAVDHTTLSATQAGGSRHTVTTALHAEPAPPPEVGEGAGVTNSEHCG